MAPGFMNILLIAQEAPLDPAGIVTGNAVRCQQLRDSLQAAGHAVTHIYPQGDEDQSPNTFQGRDGLRSQITRCRPGLILVSYWELVKLLPEPYSHRLLLALVSSCWPEPVLRWWRCNGAIWQQPRNSKLLWNLSQRP